MEKPTEKTSETNQLRKEFPEYQGYTVEEMWECNFKENFRNSTEHIRNKYLPEYYQNHKRGLTKQKLLDEIQNGELFGIAEVNIEVPDTWSEVFHQDCSPKEFLVSFHQYFAPQKSL